MMEGTRQGAQRFVDATGLRAPVFVGTPEVGAAFGMEVYPWTVVIGRDGKPVFAIRGGRSEAEFKRIFDRYL